ncbi:MAG: hypothetical protein ACHQNT_06175 [Bacteroidia bacterium]
MKCKLVFILFLIAAPCFSQSTVRNYQILIKGKVKWIAAYKGGAAPTDEMLAELRKPVAFKNDKLFLKKSFYSNKSFLLETDSTGNFELRIKPGVYNIYLSDVKSADKKPYNKKELQATCEEEFKSQSYGTLRVYRKSNYPVEIIIEEKIDPCGPLPPAAPPAEK